MTPEEEARFWYNAYGRLHELAKKISEKNVENVDKWAKCQVRLSWCRLIIIALAAVILYQSLTPCP